MKLIAGPDTDFKNQVFTVEMTGEDFVRLYDIAAIAEGGEKHRLMGERFTNCLHNFFPRTDFLELRERLINGKLP